jgi:aryl-alcohol dehydrogenase-like predicted oxidoreductase
MTLDEVFPPDHIQEFAERTMTNLGIPTLDLLQFHVWEDAWAHDDRWWRAMSSLRDQGLIGGIGVSVNRWEPWNVLETLRTGQVDAVQVIYNVFDQSPEDELFPLCRELDVAVIARVPFDEGSLTGTMTKDTRFPESDFRHIYFGEENLEPTLARVDALRADVPAGMTMPELALRFILADDRVSTVIPGMRSIAHVESNVAVSDAEPLTPETTARLRTHRWDRTPTAWSL